MRAATGTRLGKGLTSHLSHANAKVFVCREVTPLHTSKNRHKGTDDYFGIRLMRRSCGARIFFRSPCGFTVVQLHGHAVVLRALTFAGPGDNTGCFLRCQELVAELFGRTRSLRALHALGHLGQAARAHNATASKGRSGRWPLANAGAHRPSAGAARL